MAVALAAAGSATSAEVAPNSPPTARVSWTPATGPVPSFVQFDGRASSDPDPGDELSYAWDLDADGLFDDATGSTANMTYRTTQRIFPQLRVTDRAGAASIYEMEVAVVPKGTVAGTLSRNCRWRAQYFRDGEVRGRPSLARCEIALRHDWDFGRPTKRIRPDGFSARWKGPYRFPGGPTRFEVSGDDALRIWIDGRKVFDRWTLGAYGRYEWVQIVRAGIHDVTVEYAERQGTASVAVAWAPTTTAPYRPRKVK